MASILDWSSTPGTNVTVGGVSIAEGCPPANINNAIRSVMAIVNETFTNPFTMPANLTVSGTITSTGAIAPGNLGYWFLGTAGGNPAINFDANDYFSYDRTNNLLNLWIGGTTVFSVGASGVVTGGVPTGAVLSFAMSTAPTGFLACNGSAVSRSTYAALFAAIGTTYGAGDGSTTFNLPDLRGEFIRGFDNGRGVDSGRVFGSAQSDQIKAHTHSGNILTTLGGAGPVEEGRGDPDWQMSTIGSFGGNETRPRNIALLYCIKT